MDDYTIEMLMRTSIDYVRMHCILIQRFLNQNVKVWFRASLNAVLKFICLYGLYSIIS